MFHILKHIEKRMVSASISINILKYRKNGWFLPLFLPFLSLVFCQILPLQLKNHCSRPLPFGSIECDFQWLFDSCRSPRAQNIQSKRPIFVVQNFVWIATKKSQKKRTRNHGNHRYNSEIDKLEMMKLLGTYRSNSPNSHPGFVLSFRDSGIQHLGG